MHGLSQYDHKRKCKEQFLEVSANFLNCKVAKVEEVVEGIKHSIS